jgi:hypothetical protein
VGDLYFQTDTDEVKEKTGASTWTLRADLTGSAGATGAAGANGSDGATGLTGLTGGDGIDGAAGADGSVIVYDLGDDGVNESLDLNEIAVTGDTNSIFTEPSNDKLWVNVAADWPNSDTTDETTFSDFSCAADQVVKRNSANTDWTCQADDGGGGGATAIWGMLSSNSSAGSNATKYGGWGAGANSTACVTASAGSAGSDDIQITQTEACAGVYTAHLTGSIAIGEESTHNVTLRQGTGTPPTVRQTLTMTVGRNTSGENAFAANWIFTVASSGTPVFVQMGNSGGGSPVGGSMVLSVVRIGS